VFLPKVISKKYDYKSEKDDFKVIYNYDMHDSLSPCSELNKNVTQILYYIVFKYLYSAPQQPWANSSISSKKRDKF